MKEKVPVSKATRLINSGNVILVSTVKDSKPNIITLAWQMPVSHTPPLLAISVAKTHYSHELIESSGEFVVNIPTADILDKVIYCGKHSGRQVDKFKEAGFTPAKAAVVKPPLIKECIGHIECRVASSRAAGDHTVFIGEILEASCDKGLFVDNLWDIKNKEVNLIYHLGGDSFVTAEKKLLKPGG